MAEGSKPGEVLRGIDLMVQGASLVEDNWSHSMWEIAERLARERPEVGDYATTFPLSFDEWLHQLMAWREGMREAARRMLEAPAVGARVRYKRTFGDYPLDPMPAGTTGTVAAVQRVPPFIAVRLDQHQPCLDEWDNEFHYNGGMEEAFDDAVAEFHADCEAADR